MKKLKKTLLTLCITLGVLIGFLYLSNLDYLLKAVRITYFNGYKTAFLDDYHYFENRTITSGPSNDWPTTKDYNSTPSTDTLQNTHKRLKTTAFLIIKNDSIWHESYYDGYGPEAKSNSFSMAKSYVTTALGIAIEEQKIKSLQQPITDFYPEFQNNKFTPTVGDLASMSSGLDWDEQYYSPLSIVTKAYFYHDIKELILSLKVVEQPGQKFKYSSGDTQLLAMIIEKATGEKLADYVSKKIWIPTQSNYDALWQLDHPDGMEKAYCCIASNARDFARLGKLYKDKGQWNGKQILDSNFVEISTNPRFVGAPYGYGFWLSDYLNKKIFYMRGHLGQFVIVIPKDNLIIVRLGHIKDKQNEGDQHSRDLYTYIDQTYKMLENAGKN